ncbi:MAG: alpha/beta fold hydrolase [Acidimicrobiales bacterium]
MSPPPTTMPPGVAVDLPGRGRTWVYDSGPAPGQAAVLLLHGWTSTAALNWNRAFPALAEHYRVVALDHRGHGRGIRSPRPFRLQDCADDAASLAQELGLGRVILVGYSMGGPVGMYTWRRHPEAVEGLVLCATAAEFAARRFFSGRLGSASYGLSLALSAVPADLRRQWLGALLRSRGPAGDGERWVRGEWERHDPAALVQAGIALGRFDATTWVGAVDVPTAVVVTTLDERVVPARQWQLAESIPGAGSFPVAAGHLACAEAPRLFNSALLAACRSVQEAPSPAVEPSA